MKVYILLVLLFLSLSAKTQTAFEEAEKSLMEKNYPETVRICRSIINSEPGRDDARLLLGMAYQGMQDYQSALKAYLSSSSQDEITLQYMEAECMEILGDIPSALKIYSDRIENDSTDLHATRNIARIFLKERNHEEARTYYSRLVSVYPDNYLFRKNLGVCHYNLAEELYAMAHFSRAWELNKKDLELPVNIANIYIRLQEPSNALKILADGLKYDSTNIDIIKTSAFICYRLERYDTAIYQFGKALELGDSTSFTRKYLGLSHYNTNHFLEAIPHLRAYYLSDTLDTEATYYLGMALTSMHDKIGGIDFLNRTVELMSPDSTLVGSIFATIGQTWSDINERENSIENYTMAINYQPERVMYILEKAKLHDQLGIMHNNREHLNLAISAYESFLEKQTLLIEEVRISRGLDKNQISGPGLTFSRDRIKKIKNELFFLGVEEE